jgi:hypothetical protein
LRHHSAPKLPASAHVVDQLRIARCQPPEYSGRHFILAQKALNFSYDMHIFILMFRRATRTVEPLSLTRESNENKARTV